MPPPSKRFFLPILGIFKIVLIIIISTSTSHRGHKGNHTPPWPSSSCGNIKHIKCPFWLSTEPLSCGVKTSGIFELECRNNKAVMTHSIDGRYYHVYVQDINYQKQTMRLADFGIKRGDLSSCPRSSYYYYFYYHDYYNYYNYKYTYDPNFKVPVAFIHCLSPVNSVKYVKATFCGNRSSIFYNSTKIYSYVVDGNIKVSDLEPSCTVDECIYTSHHVSMKDDSSLASIYESLSYGSEFDWSGFIYNRKTCWGAYTTFLDNINYYGWRRSSYIIFHVNIYEACCRAYYAAGEDGCRWWIRALDIVTKVALIVALLLALRFVIGFSFQLVLVVYKWQRRHLSMDKTIEEFLQGHHNLAPIQYTYSEIKKMTNNFSQKLGEGGYGIVYKGKLRSGPHVAIKLMEQSISTEDEFINEVATIGQIHHVNVVQLIGFCVERSKCALVYEFLLNGSLDRYIFNQQSLGILALTYEKMFEIVLGVARGIGYLHHGCNMQILHFDIKPHNVLLDEKFNPKISDFGLARLHPPNESFITLTAARGTTGYMAPEMFYRNIGGISYKADIYSFGMLLMEIASRRKNMNSISEDTNQIYFPSWIYDQLCQGNDIEINDATEEERKIVKKIILVALWCIQLRPSDRPLMNKVIEMLEGESEPQMPPKPFVAPREMANTDQKIIRTYSVDYISFGLANN